MTTPQLETPPDIYRSLVEESTELIVMIDATGTIAFVNQASEEILGYEPSELIGRSYEEFVDPADVDVAAHAFAQVRAGRPRVRQEVAARHKDGHTVHLFFNGRPTKGENGDIRGVVAVASDITELRAARDRLAALANEDDLTGLPNRRRFLLELERHLAEPGGRGVVLMLDVDGLKHVNDLHGHAAGDRFIVELGRRMYEAVDDVDVLARLRGDEFAVLMPDATPDQAVERVEALLRSVSAREFPVGPGVAATASVGGLLLRPGITADEVLREADAALYEAKRRGGNRAVIA
ncbi:MAG TPA: sensor domain-containing diguanylate cyclase [Solirubrobacterales bacterium]|nr:sensor domain-containing diguanylate cyclase [Solirubrobacterales bacterium]